MMKHKAILWSTAVLLGSLLGMSVAQADATVTTPATANVSADGVSAALPTILVTEGAAGDIHTGTLTWTLPGGFIFDTGAVADVVYTGTSLAGSATVSFPTSSTMSVTITAPSTAAGTMKIGSTTPLKVKASSGTPMASGNITLTSGTIAGVTSSTNFGTLTEVPGAAAKLAFTVQPAASVNTGAVFNATVAVKDKSGNTVTTDSGRAITLSAALATNTATAGTGTLGGMLTMNDTNGIAAFSNLTYTAAEAIQLKAASANLDPASSSPITVSGTTPPTVTPPPTTVCDLPNGILIRMKHNPTVYMVVNCTLRPFTSAAIFHARGKKFKDIREEDDLHLGVGRPVGESDDDDDNHMPPCVLPPQPMTGMQNPQFMMPCGSGDGGANGGSASGSGAITHGTGTSLSGQASTLPNGSVVKVPNDPTVYMVVDGKLQPFTSMAIFRAHGKHFSDIRAISKDQLNLMSVSTMPVQFPDNTLVQGSNHTVFLIQGGHKHGIPSMNVLNRHHFSVKNVIKLNDNELNGIEDGGVED